MGQYNTCSDDAVLNPSQPLVSFMLSDDTSNLIFSALGHVCAFLLIRLTTLIEIIQQRHNKLLEV